MLNDLLLLSGNDIPLEQVNLLLHPPTIKEISLIGEECFFTGCELLRFSKDRLKTQDKNSLDNLTNFDIIMSMMRDKNPVMQQQKVCALMVLSLLFPTYTIQVENKNFQEPKILFQQKDLEFSLDRNNYEIFVKALNEILCLGGSESDSDYNPSGNLARDIADKLRDRHAKIVAARGEEGQKVAILSRYISILAVGEYKDINELMQYTVYQLFDEFKRYQLKLNWDIVLKARMAGAKDIEDAEDWMEDIHSKVDRTGV